MKYSVIMIFICIAINANFVRSNNLLAPGQRIESIGDFKLESGAVIKDCRLGYRTHGRLNSQKSNAVIYLTWFGGNSQGVESTSPWHAIDTTKYCLIIVDALGDGVSSSPSNSVQQHGKDFPFFSIRDMVNSQYQLLSNTLGIQHIRAVMGVSMGGIQTFQWAVSYPGFTDFLIPIVGSPQPVSFDLMLCHTFLKIIESDAGYNHGNYTVNPVIPTANMLWDLFLTTPEEKTKTMPRTDIPKWLADRETGKSNDWNNTYYQMTAIINHDISKPFNGSLKEAAAHVTAKMLIISSQQDHMVNPNPAIEFSKLLPAKLVLINSTRGHMAPDYDNLEIKNSIHELFQSSDVR